MTGGMNWFDSQRLTMFFAELERVFERCPVRIVAASYNAHPWPYRLQHVGEVTPSTFNWSNCRILDSGKDNPEKTNEDVLAKAEQLDVDEVVAKDYPRDQDRTTESIREFARLHDPTRHGDAWLPLQPPYADHYPEVKAIVDSTHLEPRYMLGGLAGADTTTQLDELRAFYDVAPPR